MRKLILCFAALSIILFSTAVYAADYRDMTRTATCPKNNRYAIYFNANGTYGITDYIYFPDFRTPLSVYGLSIEFWITVDELPFIEHCNLMNHAGSAFPDGQFGWQITGNKSDSSMRFMLANGTACHYIYSQDLEVYSRNHIVMSYNATDGMLRAYVNATEVSNTYVSAFSPWYDTGSTISQTGDWAWNGTLDEMRHYNRSLSPEEITYSYNNGAGRHLPLNRAGMYFWIHLNEGEGLQTWDEIQNWVGNMAVYEGEGVDWVEGFIESYPPYAVVSNLRQSEILRLYNSSNGLLNSATANSQGIANVTVPELYLDTYFTGTYSIYDANLSPLYSKSFSDALGGDGYQAIITSSREMSNIVSIFLPIAGFGMVIAFILCFVSVFSYSKDMIESFISASILSVVSLGIILLMLVLLSRMGV